jgi:hypothetical protein
MKQFFFLPDISLGNFVPCEHTSEVPVDNMFNQDTQ